MSSKESVWQVNIDGEIHEAELETLKQWISEGRVLPTDHVRKGGLNWIPAHRAPALRGLLPDADLLASRCVRPSSALSSSPPEADLTEKLPTLQSTQAGETSAHTGASGCRNHPERAPAYVCRICGATFCSDCPQFVGSSRIPTCPSCGDLCAPIGEANEKERKSPPRGTLGTTAPTVAGPVTGSPFGLADFGRAMRYPLQRPIGLVAIAVFYGFLQLGGLKTQLMAFAILFGCLALVIKQVAWGRLERSFIPEFNDFSFADDVLGPALLGLGTTIVTFGPFIMLLLAMLTGWIGSPSALTNAPEAHLKSGEPLTAEGLQSLINSDDPKQDEITMKKLQQLHPAAQATQYVKQHTPHSEADPLSELVSPLLNSTGMIMGLGLLTLGWALIYYPMALAVAGYSEDFWSVINPLVGLDTIRRMGLTYVKAFFMYLGVQATGFALGMITAVVTAPLALPLVGNLPARIIGAVVTFYCSLVVAFILGMALHKCADQLNIPTD